MPHTRSYSAEAIVLKHSDFSEADRILTLFTPYKGKIHAIAKGIRRPVSKKAGHLELLCHSRLQIAQGRNLDIITQAQSIDSYSSMRRELWHMTCGFYLAELIDRCLEDDTEHRDVYTLLLEMLSSLEIDAREVQTKRQSRPEAETSDVVPMSEATEKLSEQVSKDPGENTTYYDRTRLLLRYFEIHVLALIGYEPVLQNCTHCGAEIQPQENGFNAALGGVLCPQCSHLWGQALSMNALKVLRLLQRTPWKQVPRFHLPERIHSEMEIAMQSLLRFHLEREVRSWGFLQMIRTQQAGISAT